MTAHQHLLAHHAGALAGLALQAPTAIRGELITISRELALAAGLELSEGAFALLSEKGVVLPGDVVQISPHTETGFAGCFALVEEVMPWGVLAFVTVPGQDRSSAAYVRLERAQMELVGRAPWRRA